MPPDAGDLTYTLHLLQSLRGADVRLTVLAMCRTGEPVQRASDSEIAWVRVPRRNRREKGRLAVRSLFSRLPNVAAQYNTVMFRRALSEQMARDWDAIIIDHLGMGWVWPAVEAYQRRKAGVVSVFIAHNCEGAVRRNVARHFRGSIVRKIGLTVDAAKADLLEKKLVGESDLISVITTEDRDFFGGLDKTLLITPGYAGVRVPHREINDATPRRVLILGSATWLAKEMNLIEFLTAADTLFYQHQIALWVVGKVPDHLQANNHFLATRFLGFVEDLQPILRNVRIGIVAERIGGGFKLKSLDYIFNRVPIAAIKGSIAGLPLAPGLHYLSFESMRELAEGIGTVINDIKRLNFLQQAAYERCSTGFDWSDRGRILSNAIRQAFTQKVLLAGKCQH